MGDIYRDYLKALDAAGMDLFLDFQFTGQAGASSWGDFAKLHRMDEPLADAHRYRAIVAAATGTLWASPPPAPPAPLPPPTLSIASAAIMEGNTGRRLLSFTISLSAATSLPVSFRWNTINGTATAGRDYLAGSGTATIAAGQRTATVNVWVLSDRVREADERFFVGLSNAVNATLSATASRATGLIVNDDGLSRAALAAAFASVDTFNRKTRG
jgi:hypothetical protein